MLAILVANTVVSFLFSALFYLLCWSLFKKWKLLPGILAWSAVYYFGLFWGPYVIYLMVFYVPLMILFGLFGSLYLELSVDGTFALKYCAAFVTCYPAQLLLLTLGTRNPYHPREFPYIMLYDVFILFSFNLSAFLLCWWQREISTRSGAK